MDLVQIRYFLALAKSLNFTRAAEACDVSQPTLTKSIQRLESELGGPLILRERNLSQLTELGRCLLPTLQQTFDAAENARRQAAEFRHPAKAPLRLGVGPDVETSIVLPLIAALQGGVAGLEFTLRHGSIDEINEWLLHSSIDVGLVADAAGLTERAQHWKLFDDPVVVLLPDQHPLGGHGPVATQALRDRLCVGALHEETPLGRARARIVSEAGGRSLPRHQGSTAKHVAEMVRAGLGLGLSTERHGTIPGLAGLPISPPAHLRIHVAAVAGRPPNRAASLFLKLARARDWNVTQPAA